MSDDFEQELQRWLRERGSADRATLRAIAGNVAALPPRRRQAPLLPLVVAIAAIVAVAIAALAVPDLSGVGADATPDAPTDAPTATATTTRAAFLPGRPEQFAGDPRLVTCTLGPASDMEYAFEMARGRDYRFYIPEMGRSPELEGLDEPVFVLVYRDGFQPITTGGVGHDQASSRPGHRTVCMVVDDVPIVYGDVAIAGLNVPRAEATPTPSASSTSAPAWTSGAAEALSCDGRPTGLGATSTWVPGRLGTTNQPTPDLALAQLLAKTATLYVAFPSDGFRQTDGADDVAVFTYAWRGATRAIVIIRSDTADGSGPWYVDDLAACDPAELDPDLEPGVDFGAWRDRRGVLADADMLKEHRDCYGGTQLMFEGRLYVWDPNFALSSAYDPARLDATLADDVELPLNAVDTGYTGSGRALWLAADGTAAYIVRTDGTQRWPHVKGDEYLRTDCN